MFPTLLFTVWGITGALLITSSYCTLVFHNCLRAASGELASAVYLVEPTVVGGKHTFPPGICHVVISLITANSTNPHEFCVTLIFCSITAICPQIWPLHCSVPKCLTHTVHRELLVEMGSLQRLLLKTVQCSSLRFCTKAGTNSFALQSCGWAPINVT